mgnify:CR=1 FL=1
MLIEQTINKKEIVVDKGIIVVESKYGDGYMWNDVYFKYDKEIFPIGTYCTYDFGFTNGWMEYNSDTIALMSEYGFSHEKVVIALFDIKTRLFIDGRYVDLLQYYNKQFNGVKSVTRKLSKGLKTRV